MDKNEFVEKNRSFIKRMIEKHDILMKIIIIPKFIEILITAKKIANLFGYSSLIVFLKEAYKDEDKIVDLFESFDEEKQNKISELYDNVFIPQTDDIESDLNTSGKMVDQIELSENIIDSTGDCYDDGIYCDEDDDSATIKDFIIDKFFDGVDIIEEFGLNDDDDDDNE